MGQWLEPGLFHPLGDRFTGEAEPAVGMPLAQKFQIMRGEIDDQQPPLRPQQARRIAQRTPTIIEEVKDLMDDDDVETVGSHCEVEDVAMPDGAIFQPGAIEAGFGERQHVAREIDPHRALSVRPEQFEHAASAGAEIEQSTKRPVVERRDHRAFNRGVRDMQASDLVPLDGVLTEIVLGGAHTGGTHRGKPLAVAAERTVLTVEPAK